MAVPVVIFTPEHDKLDEHRLDRRVELSVNKSYLAFDSKTPRGRRPRGVFYFASTYISNHKVYQAQGVLEVPLELQGCENHVA